MFTVLAVSLDLPHFSSSFLLPFFLVIRSFPILMAIFSFLISFLEASASLLLNSLQPPHLLFLLVSIPLDALLPSVRWESCWLPSLTFFLANAHKGSEISCPLVHRVTKERPCMNSWCLHESKPHKNKQAKIWTQIL